METRYIILENGIPSWQNALELPCTSREKAEAEITRLEAMQRENNEKRQLGSRKDLKGSFLCVRSTIVEFSRLRSFKYEYGDYTYFPKAGALDRE